MNNNTKGLLITLTLLLVAGSFLTGWYAKGRNFRTPKNRSVRLGQYHFTNPLLSCENSAAELNGALQLVSLKASIEKVVARRKQSGDASDISVYFSDLNNDNTIEINGQLGFEPASLVKLPLMMEYFKRAESDPAVLKKMLVYDGKHDWTQDQNYRPQKTQEAGKSYVVDELIYRMVVHSDNNAFRTLLTQADRGYLQSIHINLGVETVADASGARLVTAGSYAIFLKTLYNASFLNQEMSEKALSYLAANEFHLGIDSVVPNTIPVASKFGERTTGSNGEIKQLHDYGIVYYPDRPYLICIMTKGSDFMKLTEAIREIAKVVFDAYDARYRAETK